MPKRDLPSDQARKEEIRRTCVATRASACERTGDCLECRPVEQSLRAAAVTLAKWPRAPRPRKT